MTGNNLILISTLLLTVLSLVGLVFFIKSSVKERTQQVKLVADEPEESLFPKLYEYFTGRAYRIQEVNAAENTITFQGTMRPSWFLAIFLSLLAFAGFVCLYFVISFSYPALGNYSFYLVALSPLAGVFYWRNSTKTEKILLKIDDIQEPEIPHRKLLTIAAHKDELKELQKQLPFSVFSETESR
jgi:hypothetical protein